MNIYAKFIQWPERAQVTIRLHLYDATGRWRCDMPKLVSVFELAKTYGIQEEIRTNLNRLNAVNVHLNNYVLRLREYKCAHAGGWGDYWGFLLGLIKQFPGDVYVDPPEDTEDYAKGTRYALTADGEIAREIQTWDDMA